MALSTQEKADKANANATALQRAKDELAQVDGRSLSADAKVALRDVKAALQTTLSATKADAKALEKRAKAEAKGSVTA